MKKILSLLLASLMCLSMIGSAFASEFKFTDVSESDWFYTDVKTAVESGLVNGKTDTTYAPADNLTYAEAIKLAACMNQLYEEGVINLTPGDPWYQPYVDYCMAKGIIDKEYIYTDNATRVGYMGIFAKALPEDGLKGVNNVPDNSIPDVPSSKAYAEGIYKLYRAGILTGVDEAHNCNPLANITRAEVAAILTRMMNADKRLKFNMGTSGGGTSEGGGGSSEGGGGSSGGGGGSSTKTEKLEIKTQPKDAKVKLGEAATVSVAVKGGNKPYTYKWQIATEKGGSVTWFNISDGESFAGADEDTLEVKLSTASARKVRCIITDDDDEKITSDEATLTFEAEKTPLSIKYQPEDVASKAEGSTEVDIVVTGGTEPYTYKWQIKTADDWADISDNAFFKDSDTDCITITLPEEATEIIRCVVTDAEGEKVTSDEAEVVFTEDEVPLSVKLQPVAQKVASGEEVLFNVEAEGGKAPYTYSWQCVVGTKWADIPESAVATGTKTKTLTAKVADAGDMEIRCVITDADGKSVNSKVVIYTVTAAAEEVKPLAVKTQPETKEAETGKEETFTVLVEGGKKPYSYQWKMVYSIGVGKKQTVAISGATKDSVTLTAPKAGEIVNIFCEITDAAGNKVISEKGALKGVAPEIIRAIELYIAGGSDTFTIDEGETRKMEVSLEGGKAPYTYLWEYMPNSSSEWEELSEEAELEISDKYADGSIKLTVTDSKGNKKESNETLIDVIPADPLTIKTQPANKIVGKEAESATAYFEVEVEGGVGPYKYQWMLGNKNQSSGAFEYAPMKDTDARDATYIVGSTSKTLYIITKEVRAFIVYCVITDAKGNEVKTNTVSLSRP